MTDCSDASRGRAGAVYVASPSPVIAAAVAAGLMAVGWTGVLARDSAGLRGTLVDWTGPAPRVILVADEEGALPDLPAAWNPPNAPGVIVVGGRCAARSALAAVEDGAGVVVDGDQPLQAQIRALDRALTRDPGSTVPEPVVATLRCRVREDSLLARLTGRELQVLDAMSRGESAAEIATSEVVSLSTVRTHIRAVLLKLEVTSQLAAVALAHRSRHHGQSPRKPRQF